MHSKPLTPQQQKVLNFVSSFQQEHGYPPTLREIGDAIGLANVNAVRGHLDALERKGHITRTPDRARSIKIVAHAPSRRSRFKQKLHEIMRTDEGVLHRIVYGVAWLTHVREPFLVGTTATHLQTALKREAAERGWNILEMKIEPDHVVVIVETWPNHSPQRTVQRLQSAGNSIRRYVAERTAGAALWGRGYVATTDMDELDAMVDKLLSAASEEY